MSAIIWNSKDYTIVWVQEWNSSKNNNEPYISVNLSDEYWNTKSIFKWINKTENEIIENLRLFQKGDNIKMQETYSVS